MRRIRCLDGLLVTSQFTNAHSVRHPTTRVTQVWVPHLSDGFIVAKVGIAR